MTSSKYYSLHLLHSTGQLWNIGLNMFQEVTEQLQGITLKEAQQLYQKATDCVDLEDLLQVDERYFALKINLR